MGHDSVLFFSCVSSKCIAVLANRFWSAPLRAVRATNDGGTILKIIIGIQWDI